MLTESGRRQLHQRGGDRTVTRHVSGVAISARKGLSPSRHQTGNHCDASQSAGSLLCCSCACVCVGVGEFYAADDESAVSRDAIGLRTRQEARQRRYATVSLFPVSLLFFTSLMESY